MLDVSLRNLAFSYGEGFALRGVTLSFPKSTHTAIVGPPACGASTLLALIAGTLPPASGEIFIGTRDVTSWKAAKRPLLAVTSQVPVPGRWSVQHALIAAVRTRTLDRVDRQHEYALAAAKWQLEALLERRVDSLSSSEQARVHLAGIELLRPAILIADRLLEHAGELADELYRTLRVIGATVISAPASRAELAMTDAVVVLSEGRVVQSGNAAVVYAQPVDEAAAIATGDVNVVPVVIRGRVVRSAMGEWELDTPPFQGSGVALVRPDAFLVAERGEDSDFVFGIEEAGFRDGRWLARGMLSGGVSLRVQLPAGASVSKGKLLPLRYDPSRFALVARELPAAQPTVPTDVVPPMRETR